MSDDSGKVFPGGLPKKRKEPALAKTGYVNELREYIAAFSPPYTLGEERPPGASSFSVIGIIWDTGPGGEANYTDERYWVKPQQVDAGNTFAAAAIVDDANTFDQQFIITATNLSERDATMSPGTGTHGLAKNTIVRVYLEVDGSDPPKARYTLSPGGGSLPRPRPKYTVLMPYNDSEDVAFDGPRFQAKP